MRELSRNILGLILVLAILAVGFPSFALKIAKFVGNAALFVLVLAAGVVITLFLLPYLLFTGKDIFPPQA